MDEGQLTQMLTGKYKSGKRMVALDVIPKAIRLRNITFDLNEDLFARLKASGATDDVLTALREVRPPPPAPPKPVPPPKPVTASLTVRCNPAECTVLINNDPFAQSKGGVFQKQLPLGKHTVLVTRTGYGSEQRAVNLTVSGETVVVTLKPDEATKARFGGEILKQMLKMFPEDAPDVTAKGSWRTSGSGTPMELSFAFRSGPKETALILDSSAGGMQLVCEGETCQVKGKETLKGLEDARPRRQLKPDEARKFEAELRFFRRYLPANILRDIRAGISSARLQASAEAETPEVDGQFEVQLDGTDERFALTLTSQYLPISITRDVGTGTDRRESAIYSDFGDVGSLKYPKRIQVKAPGDKGNLIEVRLDRLR
ncbi:MAG: hypothetical protein H7039_09330 [Bryobacteraceae bacterium]|nr:hypothetical protein [Bryobacteraceae bacterium]